MSSVVIAGDTSGTITIAAPAVAGSGTLTLPVATDTLAGIAATQTLTNKTLTSPTLTAPALGTPTALVGTNISGTSTTFSAGFGVNQTYTSPTRVVSTNYTNSGTKPRFVTVMGSSGNPVIIIDGVSIQTTTSGQRTCQAVIPPGSVYSLTLSGGLVSWTEMGV